MKSTGVTRKIDELGRIVIPKEIRRMLSIRDGENLEIFIEENKIILQKYLVMENLTDLSQKIVDIIFSSSNETIIVTDREKVIAISEDYKNLINKELDYNLLKYIDNRENFISSGESKIDFGLDSIIGNFVITPIINNIDCLGLIIMKKETIPSKDDLKLLKIIARILAEKININ